MEIDQIREEMSIELNQYSEIADELNDTSPGHYGVNYWEIEVLPKDIWIDIPKRTFSFKNGSFSFRLIMGASRGDHSFEEAFSKSLSDQGTWDFSGNDRISINSIEAEFNKDLYGD